MQIEIKTILDKIKIIYIPFLIIAIGFVCLYTFFHWLLFIRYEVFSIKEVILNLWLPFVFPWIPILIWLRPKINLLKINKGRVDKPILHFFAVFAIVAPTIIAQDYITSSTGKLSHLKSVNYIDNQEKTKYYSIDHLFIDKTHIGVYQSAKPSGKFNESIDCNIFLAIPIFENIGDTLFFTIKGNDTLIQSNSKVRVWFGIKYTLQISNNEEKEKKYAEFYRQIFLDYYRRDLDKYKYFERLGNNDDHDSYNMACRQSYYRTPTSEPIVLIAMTSSYEMRNGETFGWIFGSFGIGACVWFILILIPGLDKTATKRIVSGKSKKGNNFRNAKKNILSVIIPRKGYLVTSLLVYLNVLIFVLMVFSGKEIITFNNQELLDWGANFKPFVSDGQWWRLLTCTFIHGGLVHLIANMYGLLLIGIFLEPLLGQYKYASAYLVTGILASLTSIWWHDATISVGASGAIFGLFGVFIFFLLTKIFQPEFKKAFLVNTLIFVGFNLIIGTNGGIDNAAHIGGLLSGMCIGFIYYPFIKLKRKRTSSQSTLNKDQI